MIRRAKPFGAARSIGPAAMTANSSPPSRAVRSLPRTTRFSRTATSVRTECANFVAQFVVDRFEVIQVDRQQAQMFCQTPQAAQAVASALSYNPAIGKSGQWVTLRNIQKDEILAMQFQHRGNAVGEVREEFAPAFRQLAGLLVNDAQCFQRLAILGADWRAGVEADRWITGHQRIIREAQIARGILDDKNVLCLRDSVGAECLFRGVSAIGMPTLALNHWRSASTSDTIDIGTSKCSAASCTRRSNDRSGGVSRML